MKTQNQYWLTISVALSLTLTALFTVGWLFWDRLALDSQQIVHSMVVSYFGYFFTAGFVLFLAFGFAADWIFRAYVKPINRMAEEIDLINRVNPDLRVTIRGSHDVRRLGKIINIGAELLANRPKVQADKMNLAHSEIETEKAILASVLSNLPQAILVCNLDGRIVFYNRKIKSLLLRPEDPVAIPDENNKSWVGLDRSVYQFIDRSLIQEALGRMVSSLDDNRHSISERFLLASNNQAILPADLLPVFDSQHHITGFIIYVEDVMIKMKKEKAEAEHLQLWQYQLTQSISIIKTATELLRDEPAQSIQESQQMVQIIAEQSDLAAQLWTKKEIANKWSEKRSWSLTSISVGNWSHYLVKQVGPVLEMEVNINSTDVNSTISIDIHHLTECVVTILAKAQAQFNIDTVTANLYQKESWLYVDIIWNGQGIEDDTLTRWKAGPLNTSNVRPTITTKSILVHHGAKIWPYRIPERPDKAGIRLLIPTMNDSGHEETNGRVTILPESRPEFYDFNLFQQAGQSPALDNERLQDLTYTVFDTETTGLDPSGGDEIISIGAMRIVNGRLLQEDQFNQLIDPKRHLPWASVKYHGIRPEMLVDRPSIEQVLPKFQRFVHDTVLVGHNVAFDMRMLQVKEALTGVRFINPVLDTMLLSSIVHPAQENHNLGSIAERVGVQIRGRHTAVGDAIATGEIFLKLLPLLFQKGIHTIGEAIEASKHSYYARLKY